MLFEPAKYDRNAGKTFRPSKKWNREPTDEEFEAFFPQYVEWTHSANSEIAKIIGGDYVHILQDSYAKNPFWQFWVYHCNGEKECVAQGDGQFDPALIGRPGEKF